MWAVRSRQLTDVVISVRERLGSDLLDQFPQECAIDRLAGLDVPDMQKTP